MGRALRGYDFSPKPLTTIVECATNINERRYQWHLWRGRVREQVSLRIKLQVFHSRRTNADCSGWWGFDVQEQGYNGSFWVKGNYSGIFTASFVNYISNVSLGTALIDSADSVATQNGWLQYNYTLVPTVAANNSNNTFVFSFDGTKVDGGSLDFNLISLFPPTYNDRPNGMRIDLMNALAALNPSFLRLPGGNNLEGNDAPYLWYWNDTIGPLTDRPGRPGTWDYENTVSLNVGFHVLS